MTSTFLRRHKMAVLGVALAVTAAGLLVMTRPTRGSAAIGDMTCLGGQGTVTFTPGAGVATRTFQNQITGALGACVSLTHVDITGGTFVINGTGTGNCITGGSGSGAGTVTFNDPAHSTSTFTVDITVGFVAGIPTMSASAHIIGGAFSGDMVLGLPLTAGFNPADCATPNGLTSATFGGATIVAS